MTLRDRALWWVLQQAAKSLGLAEHAAMREPRTDEPHVVVLARSEDAALECVSLWRYQRRAASVLMESATPPQVWVRPTFQGVMPIAKE